MIFHPQPVLVFPINIVIITITITIVVVVVAAVVVVVIMLMTDISSVKSVIKAKKHPVPLIIVHRIVMVVSCLPNLALLLLYILLMLLTFTSREF